MKKEISIGSWIKFIFIVGILGAFAYYIITAPDCIKMAGDGSLKCRCFFNSSAEWDEFKKNTRGLNGDGWESVAVSEDPCKTESYLSLKRAFGNDGNSSSSSSPSSTNNSYHFEVDTQATAMLNKPHQTTKPDSFNDKPTNVVKPERIVQNEVETDSINLITQSKDFHYVLTDKLPLTYHVANLRFTFKRDSTLKVDCYDGNELYRTYNCQQKGNDIILVMGNGKFTYTSGKLYLIRNEDDVPIQLSLRR